MRSRRRRSGGDFPEKTGDRAVAFDGGKLPRAMGWTGVRRSTAVRRSIYIVGSVVAGMCFARPVSSQPADEPPPSVEKAFVVLLASPEYDEARRFAIVAAERLDARLDLRDLEPHKRTGLTFKREVCEEEFGEFPCYWPRGRFDDGIYVSIENSTGYKGFKRGLYIVILANGDKESEEVASALRRARALYPDAYITTTSVYLGCVH